MIFKLFIAVFVDYVITSCKDKLSIQNRLFSIFDYILIVSETRHTQEPVTITYAMCDSYSRQSHSVIYTTFAQPKHSDNVNIA